MVSSLVPRSRPWRCQRLAFLYNVGADHFKTRAAVIFRTMDDAGRNDEAFTCLDDTGRLFSEQQFDLTFLYITNFVTCMGVPTNHRTGRNIYPRYDRFAVWHRDIGTGDQCARYAICLRKSGATAHSQYHRSDRQSCFD